MIKIKITPIASNLIEIEVGNIVFEVAEQHHGKVYIYPKTNCDIKINNDYMTKKAEIFKTGD